MKVSFPLMWKPWYKSKYSKLVERWGIEIPRLYKMGFPHNNCGGRCIAQGKREWKRLGHYFPERYNEVMNWEDKMRKELGTAKGKTILKILEKFHIPTDNVNDDEVIIKNIYVSNNDEVKENTLLLDYETSKANFEIESNVSGYVTILCEENDTVKVGQEIIVITDKKEYQHKSVKKDSNIKINQTFSKKAQEKIDELKIDKQNFKGIELVTEKIVLDYIANQENNNNHEKKRIAISSRKMMEIESLTNINRNGLVSSVSKSFNSISIDTDTMYSRKEFKGSLSILIAKVVSDLLTTDDYRHLNSYVDGSYIYIHDCIEAIILGIEKANEKVNVINLGTSETIEVFDSIKVITEFMGINPKIIAQDSIRGWIGDSPMIYLDTTKMNSFGWQPSVSIRDGIIKTLEWLKGSEWLFKGASKKNL